MSQRSQHYLIFFGRQSVDADTGQVGPIVAEFLYLPQATYINKIEPLSTTEIKATRLMENTLQDIIVKMPAVLTVRSELNNQRYITPRNIMLSNEKEIIVSVNTNSKAPILDESNYSFVGDSEEFIKELLKLVQ